MPIVRGDQNPPATVVLLVGIIEVKFHGNSVGEGEGEGEAGGDRVGVGEGVGVAVTGGKVGTLGKPCAFTTGTIATVEVIMLRTNNARVIFAKFFFKSNGDFFNIDLSCHTIGFLADLTLCQKSIWKF
jgi:hypothetical protein